MFDLVQGDMASKELIDARFDRAVQIVQGLPKTIQTDHEEKLTMYRYASQTQFLHILPILTLFSLYKQGAFLSKNYILQGG
jgi:hypothetical protein